jgi:hypothetical protein
LHIAHSGDAGALNDAEVNLVAIASKIGGDYGYEQGSIDSWAPYDGQVITVSVDPYDTMMPSDVRLPMGQPHTGTAELLYVD